MQHRLDTIFWAYFDEYLEKEKSFSLRKATKENKQKINEVYDVAYFALFQYKLWHNEITSNLDPDRFNHFAEYLVENYSLMYYYTNHENVSSSKFNLKNINDVALIKEIVVKLVLIHINKTCFVDRHEKYASSYYWLNSTLYSLAIKFQYDLNFQTDSYVKYHSIVYPFLITCAIIDIFDPKNMLKKIKQFFTKSNVAFVFKNGRMISSDEKKWILPQLIMLKEEDDWNSFILNFSMENWETFDINQRFKLIHNLSRLTTLFLKENIKNIAFIGDGDEVNHLISNYLTIFLPINDEERENEFKTTKSPSPVLFASNTRDYNPKWTFHHLIKFKDYKKLGISERTLCQFTYRIKYVENYLDLIDHNQKTSKIIASELIGLKKTGIVDTLQLFSLNGECYNQNFQHVDFLDVNLDTKKFLQLKEKSFVISDLADQTSQLVIMLKVLTLLITIDYDCPRLFHYSISELIKHYMVAFGPYSKNLAIFTSKDIEQLEQKISKLISEYKKRSGKSSSLDLLGILYKLQNFN